MHVTHKFVSTTFLIVYLTNLIYAGLYNGNDAVFVLDNNNFNFEVYGDENVWIVEFYSSWCGHCISFAPTWKVFSSKMAGKNAFR